MDYHPDRVRALDLMEEYSIDADMIAGWAIDRRVEVNGNLDGRHKIATVGSMGHLWYAPAVVACVEKG